MSSAIRARILHVTSTSPLEWEYLKDGVLLIENGKVRDIGPATHFEQQGFDLGNCDERLDQLLIPGLIDTHVHSPQIDVIGSHGEQLLDWLQKYTFPAEARFADEAYAASAAAEFIDYLLESGTTTAMVFVTSHLQATDALFEAADNRGMRLIAGKVLMDQNAIPALHDTADSGYADSEALIRKWHGKNRLGYAITPRFAGSSSSEQLAAAGKLHLQYPDTWVQTHLSENLQEIEWTSRVHPGASDYLNVYEQHGLLSDRSFFGHCLHLSDGEVQRLADAGGRAAFCPSSNLFLGSGLFEMGRLKSAGISVSLATDVGGGTSLSMLRTMADAYKVCQLKGYSLSAMEAFSMATLGSAEALQLDHAIGNLAPGKEADFTILDPRCSPLLARRVAQANSIEEELFIYMMLAGTQAIAATYVAGVEQYTRE